MSISIELPEIYSWQREQRIKFHNPDSYDNDDCLIMRVSEWMDLKTRVDEMLGTQEKYYAYRK